MDHNSASENLQVIRTLMERSALYNQTLAPIMLFVGALGVIAAVLGTVLNLHTPPDFGCLWVGTAIVAIGGAFLISRRQALKLREPFWSPPTRRVAQALLPPLTGGFCLGAVLTLPSTEGRFGFLVPVLWLLFYGCALHAAGFFMPRGIRLFGWLFIAGGCFFCLPFKNGNSVINVHLVMGFFFGFLHLAYGVYLYFTEKRKT